MITGELKNKVDALWNIFWTGGITNPLDAVEQMTYKKDKDAIECSLAKCMRRNGFLFFFFLNMVEKNFLKYADSRKGVVLSMLYMIQNLTPA